MSQYFLLPSASTWAFRALAWAARCACWLPGSCEDCWPAWAAPRSWAARYDASGTFRVDNELLVARQLHHEVGPEAAIRAGGVGLPAVDLFVEIHMPQHASCFDHPAQLDFAPLAAGAVGAQGRLQRMSGRRSGSSEAGLLQLLGELAVLLQPVAFEQGHLLLHAVSSSATAPAHGAHCRPGSGTRRAPGSGP